MALCSLIWLYSHEPHERATKDWGAVLYLGICMHKATLCLSRPFLLCIDQYSWHVLALCRINSNGEKQPLTASVHTAFFRHCMKIDGFDIISEASLSHMPAVEGTGWDQPVSSIPAIAVIEWVVSHHCMYLYPYGNFFFFLVPLLLIFTIAGGFTNTSQQSPDNIHFPLMFLQERWCLTIRL